MDDRYYRKVDLPRLDNKSEDLILDFVTSKKNQLVGWSFHNNLVSSTTSRDIYGFSNLRITNSEEIDFLRNILLKNKIKIDFTKLFFAIQRSKIRILPHTDPGRTVTLQYLIKGKAISKFWSMENFVPDISYHNKKLKLESEFIIEPHTWYLFNNSSIHSVDDIEDNERVQLVIVLTYRFENFQDAVLNFNNILL